MLELLGLLGLLGLFVGVIVCPSPTRNSLPLHEKVFSSVCGVLGRGMWYGGVIRVLRPIVFFKGFVGVFAGGYLLGLFGLFI